MTWRADCSTILSSIIDFVVRPLHFSDNRDAADSEDVFDLREEELAKLYVDSDKYGDPPASAVVEAYHNAIKDLIRQRLDQSGGDWASFVFGESYDLIRAEDFAKVEKKLLATGHRFDWSAMISVRERPDVYKPAAGVGEDSKDFSFEHAEAIVAPADAEGREQRGIGDNVVKYPKNLAGTARYIRFSDRVLQLLTDGVPAGTVAIIDDSGGTLTAPILEQFTGVICAGGTVRSHLGILTREYGIPCLMNAKISGIKEGEMVEIESTAAAKTAEAYQKGIEMTARVWRRNK
jgi:phosphohistidine swiveling domain-containing protein